MKILELLIARYNRWHWMRLLKQQEAMLDLMERAYSEAIDGRVFLQREVNRAERRVERARAEAAPERAVEAGGAQLRRARELGVGGRTIERAAHARFSVADAALVVEHVAR